VSVVDGGRFPASELQHVRFQGSFRESLLSTKVEYEAGAEVGVLALHAGIEGGTGEIGRAVARRTGATLLSFWQPSADRRYHVTSSLFDPAACVELRSFLERVRFVVSLHGHHRLSHDRHIFVGGRARRAAARLAGALRTGLDGLSVTASLRNMPPGLRGLHPSNPVNRPVDGGVQLELPPCARGYQVSEQNRDEHSLPASAPDFILQDQLAASLCRFVENQIGR
jgi:phage replication-related protein YjqB (UPF0714/DUF867 family)